MIPVVDWMEVAQPWTAALLGWMDCDLALNDLPRTPNLGDVHPQASQESVNQILYGASLHGLDEEDWRDPSYSHLLSCEAVWSQKWSLIA